MAKKGEKKKEKEVLKTSLSIKTVVLQDMVGRVSKGASQDKLLPLTGLMAIQAKDNVLTLMTTDASNTLYIRGEIKSDDFHCVVPVEQFSKLISRITSENVTFELANNILTVTGNGHYDIELPLDENGESIVYPNPLDSLDDEYETAEVNLSTVKTILNTNKAALAVTLESPVYTGYYVGDRVVSTDTYKICGYDAKLFDEPILISPEMMNLLDVMAQDKIEVRIFKDTLEFITNDCIVFGHKMEGIDEFAIDAIEELLDEEFESSCKVNKSDMLALLDRISLFVGAYDDKAIIVTFTEDGIDISSKQSNGVELIPYTESKSFKAYTCTISIDILTQQIKANSADVIEIQYGNDRSIKIVDGNITQVIALLEA